METKELEAGRELDALIAERLFGAKWYRYHAMGGRVERWLSERPLGELANGTEPTYGTGINMNVGRYSTSIVAAFRVVEKMREMNASVEMWSYRIEAEGDRAIAHRVVVWGGNRMGGDWSTHVAEEAAATMPLAICRAALAAVASTPTGN